MADEVDRAQAHEEELRADAFTARAAKRFHEEPRIVNGKRLCLDCDEPLSKKRLKAAPEAARCVECQELREEQDRRKS